MSRLAPSADGAVAVRDRSLVFYDVTGARVGEHALENRARALARFGDEWLVLGDKQKHLARIASGQPQASFAAGRGVIGTFGVGRDDAVAVARGDALELWSRDDRRRWSAKGGPFAHAAVARDHVVGLAGDGALVFFSREKGEPLGALRLASTEPAADWRLAHIDGCIVVLALGDWLVWIDATTRKTVRRVRARAKVVQLAADVDHVAAGAEDGFVQAFRATTGEPRAAFAAHDDGLAAIALGADVLYTMSAAGEELVRACDRQSLDVTARALSPISAIATRGAVAAVADTTGRIRIHETAGGELREVATVALGEAPVGISLSTKGDALIAAGTRMLMRISTPWQTPRPVPLRFAPTAFAADDAYAFTGTQTGAVDVYDLTSGRPVTSYALSHDDRVTALARLSGPLLVVGTGALDGRVLVVDVAETKVLHRVAPHDEAFGVTCLASDARGRIVASGSDDGSVALLDPVKGRLLARIRVPETPTSIAFEPAGRRLACVFADGTASIVAFAARGATVSDLGVRGATHVAWGEGLVLGYKDGRAESGERHVAPSERPAARP